MSLRRPTPPRSHRVGTESSTPALHDHSHDQPQASSRPSAPLRQLKPSKRADWTLMWEGQKKTHQISLRAVAVLAFAALAVIIVVSPLRAFINQQEQIRDLNEQLQASKDHIAELKDSIALWNDTEYVQSQARERLGYVMPGQTLYIVSGGEVDSQKAAQRAVDEANKARRAITPFYMTMWDSILVAGQSGEAGEAPNPQNVPMISNKSGDDRGDKE